jgi:hypothetical protein
MGKPQRGDSRFHDPAGINTASSHSAAAPSGGLEIRGRSIPGARAPGYMPAPPPEALPAIHPRDVWKRVGSHPRLYSGTPSELFRRERFEQKLQLGGVIVVQFRVVSESGISITREYGLEL